MKNLTDLNLGLIFVSVLDCSRLFVSGDDQKSGRATGLARLPAVVREMSPRTSPESTVAHVRILLLILTNQITANRLLSGTTYFVSSETIKIESLKIYNEKR